MTQDHFPRYAVYFTAEPGSPLARFGASIIGYDADTGRDVPQLALSTVPPAELISATQAPRRYGFHATLVAPFYLKGFGEQALCIGVEEFSRQEAPALLGPVEVGTIGDFIALIPREASAAVNELAAHSVEFFDRYRAPLSADDLARRSTGELSARQRQNLDRWGYPYVFDDFRFHMTLTGRLAPGDRPRFHEALSDAFRPIAGESHSIETVSLMRQRDPDSRFEVIARGKLSQGF